MIYYVCSLLWSNGALRSINRRSVKKITKIIIQNYLLMCLLKLFSDFHDDNSPKPDKYIIIYSSVGVNVKEY